MPGITLGDVLLNIEADSTIGRIKLYDYFGDNFGIIFSHPADFTPVCTTELGKIATYMPEFEKRGVKVIGVSNDSVEDHKRWVRDIEAYTPGSCVKFPILADPDRKITTLLNMLDADEKDPNGKPLPSRALHVVGPDRRIKLSFLYPGSTGRNIDEVLRALDSVLLSSKHKIATPANWKPGEPVVIAPSVSNEEAKKLFKNYTTAELPSGKDYLRLAKVD